MVEYSAAFRARMVQRMTGPRAVSANALSKEVGVHQPTLSRWLREAATVAPVAKKKSRPTKSGSATGIRPEAWSAEEKVRVVMESAGLADAEAREMREAMEKTGEDRVVLLEAILKGRDQSDEKLVAERDELRTKLRAFEEAIEVEEGRVVATDWRKLQAIFDAAGTPPARKS